MPRSGTVSRPLCSTVFRFPAKRFCTAMTAIAANPHTLGNLLLNPLCGLLFLEFEAGHLLQIAARGSLVLDGPELASFEGAERLLQLEVLHGGWIRNGVGLRWNDPQFATQLQATGDWPKSAE
jgi:hypothetical protein